MKEFAIGLAFFILGIYCGFQMPSAAKEDADTVRYRMQQDGWVRMVNRGNKPIECKVVDCKDCKPVFFQPTPEKPKLGRVYK